MKKNSKIIYFDYAAATPVDPRVAKAMTPYLSESFGNTMSLHRYGQEAKQKVEESRNIVAGFLNARPEEIIFTGSATESNNLALKGIAFANKAKGKHIIISPLEHPCIAQSVKWLEMQGFKITKLNVDKYGLVNPRDVENTIREDTILVSIIHGSNEIGTVQPIAKIGKICRKKGIYFHTDAVQSFGKILIDVNKMDIDLLSASSHKIYGPKGAAMLFVRQGTNIEPILHGGGQEFGLRSSTVNVPAIVGFAKAVELSKREMKKEERRLLRLRDKLIKGVLETIPDSYLNGPKPELAGKRLSNNVNFWFKFVEGESIVIQLDLMGIAASTGSACSSMTLEPSPTLIAIGLKPQEAHGSLRITLGRWTKENEINYLLKVLPPIIKKLREISPFKNK
jgi:cysteine desulfurase